MSRIIASAAIEGAHDFVRQAEQKVSACIESVGEDHKLGFTDTSYHLPIIYSLLGWEVRKLSDAQRVLARCRELLPDPPSERVWLPYLGGALDAGIATLFAQELIEACKYIDGPHPEDGIWLGAAGDVIIRERGIEFVDGTAPGFAAVVGAAPDVQSAVRIARELQERMLYVFIAGHTGGISFAEQLHEGGVDLGWHTRLVPFGKEISAAVYALGFANRAALSFGGVTPGDYRRNLLYNKERIFAFVMALGEVDAQKYATAAGAINYGFPVIADTDIPQILPSGICTYEHVVSSVPHDAIVDKCLEVRGCKVQISQLPVPVSYGAAFSGERVRRGEFHAQFGGNRSTAFEFLSSAAMDQVQDGRIVVEGPDIDQTTDGSSLPLALCVEVAGRKMEPDFEPVLERQIHHFLNHAQNVFHVGQRDTVFIRIGKEAYAAGFRLKHLGEIVRSRLLADYPAIVDKVQVTVLTTQEQVDKYMAVARETYRERNRRLMDLTDESVDDFYACTLCQSFAPTHVCMISPQRLGLCGAYSWLDGKASHEIDPTGPNQPVFKGAAVDATKGRFDGIDTYLQGASQGQVQQVNMYSLMESPMTSCGCFEAIVAVVPECNGVMVVNREHDGPTPSGMTFSELAASISGGVQVEGFMGVGKSYIGSPKFISAEGGIRRIVWMPKSLKQQIEPDLNEAARAAGVPGLPEKIADESVSVDPAELAEWLAQQGHDAVSMDPIIA